MRSLLVEIISACKFVVMKWKRLFTSNRPVIANKFLRHHSPSHTKTTKVRGLSWRGLKGRSSLLIEVCKNAIRKTPYLTLTIGFITWMLFFDSADLITQYKLTRRIKKLHEEQTYYLKQIEIVTKERQELMSSEELLEKFAREKYLMKKPTEDVYIIEE